MFYAKNSGDNRLEINLNTLPSDEGLTLVTSAFKSLYGG